LEMSFKQRHDDMVNSHAFDMKNLADVHEQKLSDLMDKHSSDMQQSIRAHEESMLAQHQRHEEDFASKLENILHMIHRVSGALESDLALTNLRISTTETNSQKANGAGLCIVIEAQPASDMSESLPVPRDVSTPSLQGVEPDSSALLMSGRKELNNEFAQDSSRILAMLTRPPTTEKEINQDELATSAKLVRQLSTIMCMIVLQSCICICVRHFFFQTPVGSTTRGISPDLPVTSTVQHHV
jgi:hypothetical protein